MTTKMGVAGISVYFFSFLVHSVHPSSLRGERICINCTQKRDLAMTFILWGQFVAGAITPIAVQKPPLRATQELIENSSYS